MKVVYREKVLRQLKKLDMHIQKKILDYMDEIALLDDPRIKGKVLTGNLGGIWRYRVEDYRIFCDIEDDKLLITVIKVGHRRDVYK